MGRPELVIFDCDGVLVDSEVIAVRVLVANLARHGLALTEADAHAMFVGGTMANNAEVARTPVGLSSITTQVSGGTSPAAVRNNRGSGLATPSVWAENTAP